MKSDHRMAPAELPPARQAYVIGVLLLMYIFAYMDRNVMALMVDAIKRTFHMSDIQFSLVHGLAFGAFYAVFGLPMGYIVDRFSKRWVLFSGISIWSLATLACGLVRNFPSLALARFGVGAGEATLVPAAYSTISAILPKDRTATGIAIFSMGSSIGSAVAIGVGGALIGALSKGGGLEMPLIGHLEPWQAVFAIIGLPGVLVALLAFTLPDTGRSRTVRTGASSGFGSFVSTNRAYLLLMNGGLAASTTMAYSMASWAPALFLRRFHEQVEWVGFAMSAVTLTGLIGFLASGYFADRLFRAGRMDGHVIPSLWTLPAVMLLSIIGFHFSRSVWLTVTCFAVIYPLITIGNSIAAHIQLATPPALRGRMAAVTVASQHLCGLALGPLLVALVTDKYFHDPVRVGSSIAIVTTTIGFLALGLLYYARRPARQIIERAEEADGEFVTM